jgi:hypothetical protein
VRVFARRSGLWVEDGTLTVGDPAPFEYLGWSVALSADGSVVLAGVSSDDTLGGLQTGSARLFLRSQTGWAEDAALIATDGRPSDGVGWSVALATDGRRALLGVPYDDTVVATDAGTARVFQFTGTAALSTPCGSDVACASGFCTDGVCCASRCGGDAPDCQACAASLTGGVDGTCAPLAAAIASTVTCRAAVDLCDAEERCSASSVECPVDRPTPAGERCRDATIAGCDPAETCDGVAFACPADVTMCGEDDAGIVPMDDAGIVPMDDAGIVPMDDAGIVAMDDAGIVPMDDAGIVAMDDAGVVTMFDAGPRDGGAQPDAGDAGSPAPDAGRPRTEDGGCGCRIAARDRDVRGALGVLVALGALLARCRRSRPRGQAG